MESYGKNIYILYGHLLCRKRFFPNKKNEMRVALIRCIFYFCGNEFVKSVMINELDHLIYM